MVQETTRLLHAEKLRDAAQCVSDFCQLDLKLDSDNPAICHPPLQYLLHWCLDNGHPDLAAKLLWKPNLFNCEPQCSKDVWKLFDEASFGLLMGGASMSKSFSMAGRLFLEWIRDPAWTTVKVVGPSQDHLEQNLFSHLVSLHQSASLPMPGEVGDLFIGLNRRDRISSISGLIIPIGRTKKSGRLQGSKRRQRSEPHPIFGEQSRMFIFLDEIENIPGGVWADVDNVISNFDESGRGGLKIFGAYNPTNQNDEVGKRAEPQFGWSSFDLDKHFRWTSIRGWEVLRLDPEKSENVVAGRTIFPGLQTRQGLEKIARNAGGTSAPGYYSMGRGAYPPTGIEMTIIPSGMLLKLKGEFIWLHQPVAVGGCDLALEGGAAAIFTKGSFGMATGIKYPPSLEHPNGRIVMFKNERGHVVPRWGLLAEKQFVLPKGDTIKMKDAVIDLAKKSRIKPEYLCLDRTGVGSGVADLVKHEWSSSIHDINYSEGASETKIMAEEFFLASESYDRLDSELWFAFRSWAEFGYLLIHPQVEMSELSQQLTQRRFKTVGKKSKVEAKKDYKSRGFSSPDEADSLTLLVHAARKGSGITMSMAGEAVGVAGEDQDDWEYQGVRIDASNRTDILEEPVL